MSVPCGTDHECTHRKTWFAITLLTIKNSLIIIVYEKYGKETARQQLINTVLFFLNYRFLSRFTDWFVAAHLIVGLCDKTKLMTHFRFQIYRRERDLNAFFPYLAIEVSAGYQPMAEFGDFRQISGQPVWLE